MHQRHQLLQQVLTERGRVGHGDAVGTRQLHLGIRPSGLWDFAVAVVGQAQFRVAKQCALSGVGFDAVLEVLLERLVERASRTLMQRRQPVHGFFGGFNDNKSFGHGKHPVF